MASIGLLSALGGALSGVGQGMVKQEEQAQKRGLEEREARRRELEEQSRRQFQTAERVAGQEFTAGRDEAARQAQAALSMENRLSTAELQQQRLDAEAALKRAEMDAQAKDPLRNAQAEYYKGGGAAGQRLVPVEVDDPDNPGQKMTVYKSAADAADQRVGSRAGAAGKETVYEQKRRAWLSLHPDDESGALDYAAGKKSVSDAGVFDMASKIVARENAGSLIPMKPEDRKRRVDETYQYLRNLNGGGDAAATPAPGTTRTPSGAEPRPKTQDEPPSAYPNARKGNDGGWYVPDPSRPGKYLKVG